MIKRSFLCLALTWCVLTDLSAQLTIDRMYCDNRTEPGGILLQDIRFRWELGSWERDQYQSAWQLVISSSLQRLQAGDYDIYHSGIVKDDNSTQVVYKGPALQPASSYYWKVQVWDKHGRASVWSLPHHFITGLFAPEDWAGARWIGYEELPDSMRVAPGIHNTPKAAELGEKSKRRPVVPLFRREFKVEKKIRSALVFITGMGQYEMSCNGKKVGYSFLSPGWTYYDKTVLYNTYDITRQLRQGANAIGVTVGNGFYNINRERYFKLTSAFGYPKLICRLLISYEDGSSENIVSGEAWRTAASPITFSSIYGGEDYDAGLEQKGWNKPGFKDGAWKRVLLVQAPRGRLVPESDYPLALTDSFHAAKISHLADGSLLYDFGQNMSGILRLRVKGKKGQKVTLTPAELVNGEGLPNQSASGSPYYLSYTLKGEGEEVWQPAFTYYGFRYVQVEGTGRGDQAVLLGLSAIHNRNSNPANGSFECSNTLFNRIDTLISWAIRSNMQSVVTDCPHREKLSWLEQDYLMGGSIHYNYDIHNLYRKLVLDLIDAQYDKGFVPDIAPEYVVFYAGFLDSPEWGSASIILPWLLYEWYGDKDIVEKAYPMMKKYLAYLETKSDHQILSHGLGDWFDYGPKQPGEAQLTPKALTATAIYYYDATLLDKMAMVLGKDAEAAEFRRQAADIKMAFNYRFFNPRTKVYSTGSQTAMAMPLCVGLADSVVRAQVLQNLVDSVYAGNKALTAGDIGFHFLVKALDEGGASQLIYDMNNRDDVPGYGYQLKKGATALTESWPALENVSNNHLMLGHIMEWLYQGLAGIGQEKNSVAFQHIVIRPQPVGDISYVTARFHAPAGWISSAWRKEGGQFMLTVEIPVNARATLYLPGKDISAVSVNGEARGAQRQLEVGSGRWEIVVK